MIPFPSALLPKVSTFDRLPDYESVKSRVELTTDRLVRTGLYFHHLKRTEGIDQARLSSEMSSAAKKIMSVYQMRVEGVSSPSSIGPNQIIDNVASFLFHLEERSLSKEDLTKQFISLDTESLDYLCDHVAKALGKSKDHIRGMIQTNPYLLLQIQNGKNENIVEVLLQRLEQRVSVFDELEKIDTYSTYAKEPLKALLQKSSYFNLFCWYIWYSDGGKTDPRFGSWHYGSDCLLENPHILFQEAGSLLRKMKETFSSLQRDKDETFSLKEEASIEKKPLLIEMVKLFVLQDPIAAIENIKSFGISSWDAEDLINLAKFCASIDGHATAKHIKNFDIDPGNQEALSEIARLCTLQSPDKTKTDLQNFGVVSTPNPTTLRSPDSLAVVDPSRYPGLANPSQNCWLNSFLQMLSVVPQLEAAYRTFAQHKLESGAESDKSWADVLLKQLDQFKEDQSRADGKSSTDTQQIRKAFHYFFRNGHDHPMFSELETKPEDVHEAISQIMKGYEEALKAQGHFTQLPTSYREVIVKRSYTPTGRIVTPDPVKVAQTRADPDSPLSPYSILGAGNASIYKKTDFEIFLPLQGIAARNADELLLRHFVQPDAGKQPGYYLGADNNLHEYRLSEERTQFSTPPDELFITVERFGNEYSARATFKITDDVPFKRYLTLPTEATVSGEKIVMELDSFIIHTGGLGGGHYVSYKKIDGHWIKFSDDHPREVLSDAQVDDALKQSYIHHYKRIDPRAIPEASYYGSTATTPTQPGFEPAAIEAKRLVVSKQHDIEALSSFCRSLASASPPQISSLPDAIQKKLFEQVWLRDLVVPVKDSDYGKTTCMMHPVTILAPCPPFLAPKGDNLAEQLQEVLRDQLVILEAKAVTEQIRTLIEALESRASTAEQMQRLYADLPPNIREALEGKVYLYDVRKKGKAHCSDTSKGPYGKVALAADLKILLQKREGGKISLIEEILSETEQTIQKAQNQYYENRLLGYSVLLSDQTIDVQKLIKAFELLDIPHEMKTKIFLLIEELDRSHTPNYGADKFKKDPRCLSAIFETVLSEFRKTKPAATSELTPEVTSPPEEIAESEPLELVIDSSSRPAPARTTAKLLFALLADEFGANSALEGISTKDVLRYVTDHIRKQISLNTSSTESIQSLLRELERASRIKTEGLLPVLRKAFDEGCPLLIPGGWVGGPEAHAVYYEAIPQKDETVNFRIFNTGTGIDNHQRVQVGVKEKVAYLEWRGIPKARLLHPHFAKILEEMATEITYPDVKNPGHDKDTNYKARDIYQSLKAFLRPKSVIDGPSASLMEPQRAGTCACRSLFAYLKTKLSKNEYRRLKLDLRIQALSGHISSPSESTLSPEGRYHLISKAEEKLSRRVHDLFVNKVIGPKTVIAAQKQLTSAQEWLSKHRIEKPPLSMDTDPAFPQHLVALDRTPSIASLLAAPKGIPIVETPLTHITTLIAAIPLDNPQTFIEEIERVSIILKAAYERKEYSAVQYGILDVVKKFPIDADFWGNIHKTPREIENAMNTVANLSQLFFKDCYRIQDSSCLFGEKEYVLTKLLFAQKKLAALFGQEIHLHFNFRKPSLYCQQLDPEISKEMKAIYLQTSSSKTAFFNIDIDQVMLDPSFIGFIFKESQFSKFIKEECPEILRRIKAEHSEFDTKTIPEQHALMFGSPHLPVWIKSLKTSFICLAHMQTLAIVPLQDSSSSLDFRYENTANRFQISLEGITPDNFIHLPKLNAIVAPAAVSNLAPIKSPMITDLINLMSFWKVNEKDVYSTENGEYFFCFFDFRNQHSPPFSRNAISELARIFSSPEHSLVEAIKYFKSHPDKLSDIDYQKLFQIACFSGASCDNISKFKVLIFSFLTNQIRRCQDDEDIKTQVFLERIGRYFKRYGCKDPNSSARLLALLENSRTNPEEKSLIYAELAASLSEKDSLTNEDCTLLLKAKAWLDHVPIPKEWKDPRTAYDMEKALSKHSAALVALVLSGEGPNTAVLNEIYTLINERPPSEALRWEPIQSNGMSPKFRSNHNDFYDPMSGRFISIDKQAYLPIEIRGDFYFQQLFSGQLKGIAKTIDIYEFSHKDGSVIVRKTAQGLIIEQLRNGSWYRFIPNHKLTTGEQQNVTSVLESRYLADTCNAWQSITGPRTIFLYDKKTNAKLYEVIYDSIESCTITRISDNNTLRKSSQLLAHIEHTSFIQEWSDRNKNRVQVELPRFKLSFTPDTQGSFECKEHPGFFLSLDQNLEAIGSCKYALILKNAKGNTRVLLPNQHLEASIVKESLEPRFTRNQALRKGESVDFTYFTYGLVSNGYLESSSKEGYFYLAQTLAVHRDYKQAAYYLRNYGEKLSAYSGSEIKVLKEIAKIQGVTGDKSGEQVAIALYANYLLATNIIKDPEAVEALPKLYNEYLLRSRNVKALRLSRVEELHLLKSLLPLPLSAQFIAKLKELEPTYSATTPSMVSRITTPEAKTEKLLLIDELIKNGTAPLPADFEKSVLLTRSASFIKKHLVDIITIAIQGSPDQKKWLETACIFCKTPDADEPTNAPLGILLELILKNPSEFPLPPKKGQLDLKYSDDFNAWASLIVSHAERLQIGTSPSPVRTTGSSVRRLIDHPTDRPPIEIPPRDFIVTPDPVPSLSQSEGVSSWTTSSEQTASVHADLVKFLASQGSGDRVEVAEWTRLQLDAGALSRKGPKTVYQLNREIPEITSALQARESAIKGGLTSLQDQMIAITKTLPTDAIDRADFLLQKSGGLLDEITLDDIFISLALKDPNRLLEQNPHLSQQNLNDLYKLAANYLQLASQGHQVERCLDLCDKISKESTEELIQQLGEQLHAKRCYDIANDPQYLVFEHYAELIMRQDQVNKLRDFLEGGTQNPVIEMIMGAGKSKVLLPLLGLLRADGTDLSMVVVPSPLFASVSSDTQAILQKAFSTSLKTRTFDRNSTFTIRSLQEIKTALETVIAKKQSLIMTSKSIQSLVLTFILCANDLYGEGNDLYGEGNDLYGEGNDLYGEGNDLYGEGNDLYGEGKEEGEELSLMIGIIRLLQTVGNPLIDEADTVLNVLHEVSFSLGNRETPKEDDIKLIGTLYELLYSDSDLKAIARLESDPHPNAEAPPLSNELYHAMLKEPLATALLAKLIEEGKISEDIKEKALHYLCRVQAKSTESKEFFEAQPREIQNLLALAGEELCSLLPHTLLKTSDEKYGLDKEVIAIPYSAANTPSHGSVFSNSHITMNYTYQIHNKNGIGQDTLIQLIDRLKNQADIQARNEAIDVTETDAYKKFLILKGPLTIPFRNNLDPDYIRLILDRINRNPKILQELIQKLFIPQMELFSKKLACNPINLIALFSRVSGFTGTLWNAGSMHKRLTALPEAGTDAKTLNILMKKCTGPALIIRKIAGSSMFEGLGGSVGPYDALIDAGGYFKEGGNLAIARKMATTYRTSVVFYNGEGVQTITDGTTETPLSASPLKEDERLTFYDQSHTTGADIKQKGAAIGLLTIGRGMMLRDLLQSVWRLRGLERGQSVQFVIDDEVASIIRAQIGLQGEEIGFKEILKFVIQNQGKQQGDDNFKAFKQQLDNLSQNLLLQVMTDSAYTENQRRQVFAYLRRVWIKPANQTPAELYGTPAFERESREVLEEAAVKCTAELDAITENLVFLKGKVDAVKDEITALKESAIASVHSRVISPQSDTEGTVEVEQSSQEETEVSREMETEGENQFERIALGYLNINKWEHVKALQVQEYLRIIPLFPIADQMKREPGLASYQDLFDGIDISMNVLAWEAGERMKIEKMRLLGPHTIPFDHLLVEEDRVTLFSQLENIISDPNYYNLTLGFADTQRKMSPKAFEKIVKLKFLNGESTFSTDELAFLKKWLTKAGVEKMKTLYFKHILKFQHDKRVAFEGSNLEHLFKSLKR